jgi:hypothetical protein
MPPYHRRTLRAVALSGYIHLRDRGVLREKIPLTCTCEEGPFNPLSHPLNL